MAVSYKGANIFYILIFSLKDNSCSIVLSHLVFIVCYCNCNFNTSGCRKYGTDPLRTIFKAILYWRCVQGISLLYLICALCKTSVAAWLFLQELKAHQSSERQLWYEGEKPCLYQDDHLYTKTQCRTKHFNSVMGKRLAPWNLQAVLVTSPVSFSICFPVHRGHSYLMTLAINISKPPLVYHGEHNTWIIAVSVQ